MISDKTEPLILDMDDLLVDTECVYLEGRLYASNKQQVTIAEAAMKSRVGESFHDTHAYLMQVCHEEVPCAEIRKGREQYIYQCLENGTLSAMPYARGALQAARGYGYRAGLATFFPEECSTTILAHLDLLFCFDISVLADNVTKLKPHPDLYLEVLKRAQVSCEHAAVFKDSLTGVQVTVVAGIQTVWISDHRFIDVEDTTSDVVYAENLSCVRVMPKRLNT